MQCRPASAILPDPPAPARTPTHACTFRYDIAVIQFGTSIGSTVGYMGLTTNLQNGYLNTAGYPGDKADGTQWFTSRNELDIYPYDKLMYTKLVRPAAFVTPAPALCGLKRRLLINSRPFIPPSPATRAGHHPWPVGLAHLGAAQQRRALHQGSRVAPVVLQLLGLGHLPGPDLLVVLGV